MALTLLAQITAAGGKEEFVRAELEKLLRPIQPAPAFGVAGGTTTE